MEYNLHGKITLADYIQFNKAYSSHGFMKYFRIVVYSGLIIYIGFSFLPDKDIFTDLFLYSPFDFIKIFTPIIFAIIFILLVNKLLMPLIYKRHYNANKKLQSTHDIKINEHNILISTETSNFVYSKSDINKIIFDKNSIYIFTGINIGNIFKKRFLENEDEFEALKQFVKVNYGKK